MTGIAGHQLKFVILAALALAGPRGRKQRHSARHRAPRIAVEKLGAIDDFVNGEIAAGEFPALPYWCSSMASRSI